MLPSEFQCFRYCATRMFPGRMNTLARTDLVAGGYRDVREALLDFDTTPPWNEVSYEASDKQETASLLVTASLRSESLGHGGLCQKQEAVSESWKEFYAWCVARLQMPTSLIPEIFADLDCPCDCL